MYSDEEKQKNRKLAEIVERHGGLQKLVTLDTSELELVLRELDNYGIPRERLLQMIEASSPDAIRNSQNRVTEKFRKFQKVINDLGGWDKIMHASDMVAMSRPNEFEQIVSEFEKREINRQSVLSAVRTSALDRVSSAVRIITKNFNEIENDVHGHCGGWASLLNSEQFESAADLLLEYAISTETSRNLCLLSHPHYRPILLNNIANHLAVRYQDYVRRIERGLVADTRLVPNQNKSAKRRWTASQPWKDMVKPGTDYHSLIAMYSISPDEIEQRLSTSDYFNNVDVVRSIPRKQ